MTISVTMLVVGIMLLVLAVVQWNLHAEDGWVGETWDSDIQEKLYNVIASMSTLCIFTSGALLIVGY